MENTDQSEHRITPIFKNFKKHEVKRESFTIVYDEYLNSLTSSLKITEYRVMFQLFRFICRDNKVEITANIKTQLIQNLNVCQALVYKAIKGLKDTNVLITIKNPIIRKELGIYSKNIYLMNPYLVSKGNTQNTFKLRNYVIENAKFRKRETVATPRKMI